MTSNDNSKEKTVLYLCDLPQGITDKDIETFLSKYKSEIIEIKTEQKKGIIAKVSFKKYTSANNCRIEMNLKKFKTKSIRIMWEEKDFSIRKSTKNNLYIKGIPKNITPREVYEYFKDFGDIFTVKISEDENGNHHGYGYITYYNQDDAKKAIDNANGKKIWNSEIEVTYSNYNRSHENQIHKIYVNNLPEKYSSEELKKLCEEISPVQSCNIFTDNQGKLFGIVQFSNEQDMKSVVEKLNNKEIKGSKIYIKIYQNKYYDHNKKNYYNNNNYYYNNNNFNNNNYYQRPQEPYQNCNLYVKNIPLTAVENDLQTIFGKCGTIKSIKIEKDDKGHSKGFGYVLFDNANSAKNAIESLSGKYLPGFESWARPLIIEYFLSKNNRQAIDNQFGTISFYNQNENQMMYPQMGQMPYPQMFIPMPVPTQHKNNYMNNQRFQHQNYKNGYRKNYNNGYHNRGRGGYHYKNNNNHYNNKNDKNNNDNEKKNNKADVKKKVNIDEFNKLKTADEKKDFLGEILFNEIQNSPLAKEKNVDVETVGKITGMIIEIPDNEEIIEIIENPTVLRERMEEALKLLTENK